MNRMNRIGVALLLAGFVAGTAEAKEGGDQYPNGAETWLAGAVPPPGNYFINYLGHYSGDLKDGNGNRAPAGSVDAWFNALRFLQISEHKILGGNWGWHVIAPLVYQDVDLGGSRSKGSLGDVTINPFILSWHTKNWHWATGLDINLPTGTYESGEPRKSIGANYWSFEPLLAVTWLGDNGWEVSAKFMYNIKGKNDEFRFEPSTPKLEYQSGDDFHVDFIVGRRFGPWGAGLSGYYLKQTTNDEIEGSTVPANPGFWSAGRKGEVFAIGPSVVYTNKAGVHFIGQWHHETRVENRFGGDKFWFKLIMPL